MRRTTGAALLAALAVVTTACGATESPQVAPAPTPSPSPMSATTPGTTSTTPKPVQGTVSITPILSGRTLSLKVNFGGSVLTPKDRETHQDWTAPDYRGLWLGDNYTFGDGPDQGGTDPGQAYCEGATKRRTGNQTVTLPAIHQYAQPGTYTLTYTTKYCGRTGEIELKKHIQVEVS
ncbi:hypothetical protein AB0P21_34445 [Kribbella sp. NPDC056861]|uniref:hypothetical protein n=1 Tax=Kribbella sp. NPDC056861 TaxID=3154857 RepID=UPI00342EC1DB